MKKIIQMSLLIGLAFTVIFAVTLKCSGG